MDGDDAVSRAIIDRDRLPEQWPTNRHSPEFWEQLGRTIASYGFLEEILGKALFAFTATRRYSPERPLPMLKKVSLPIASVRVPAKRGKTLDSARVQEIAESILAEGQKVPISVRADGGGYVLIEGLHRLEAMKALGETAIEGVLVQARLH